MIKIEKRVYITIPSEFKIEIDSVTTPEGDSVDMSTTKIIFNFADIIGNKYVCIYDPDDKDTKNTKYDSDTGVLTLIIQDYFLTPGQLSCQVGTSVPDEDFDDKEWSFFGPLQPINIVLK